MYICHSNRQNTQQKWRLRLRLNRYVEILKSHRQTVKKWMKVGKLSTNLLETFAKLPYVTMILPVTLIIFTQSPVLNFWLRRCLYGGKLARLGGLAHQDKISRSLRNSYKNIMCSYEKWALPPRLALTWFCRDPT